MENPEEILHSLEEFAKMKPKDIPRELEEYLCFVAKTGNPVYQWPTIKSLFREKLLTVITEFYESCPSIDIPPCPNVEMFNYDLMKNFILEKLDTFSSAPFTVQRICELLTTPRKEYNRIDKYMRALEKNILVVSTTEPGRRTTKNGESIMNGIEPEHLPDSGNSSHDINVEEMDESPTWPRVAQISPLFDSSNSENQSSEIQQNQEDQSFQSNLEVKVDDIPSSSNLISSKSEEENSHENSVACTTINETLQPYLSIEPVPQSTCTPQEVPTDHQTDASLSIAVVQDDIQQEQSNTETIHPEEQKVEIQELKETPVPEDSQDNKTETFEEEQIKPVSETFPSNSIEVEQNDRLADVETSKHQEEITSSKEQEQSDIENISPENNSPSSTESLPLDVIEEKFKDRIENIANLDAESHESQINQNDSTIEDVGTEIKDKVELECISTNVSSPERNVLDESVLRINSEYVSEVSNSTQPSDSKNETESLSMEKDSTDVSNQDDPKPQGTEQNSSDAQIHSELQTPMDVDVLKVDKNLSEDTVSSC